MTTTDVAQVENILAAAEANPLPAPHEFVASVEARLTAIEDRLGLTPAKPAEPPATTAAGLIWC